MADDANGAVATVVPHRNDVLFGKGTPINVHPGNVHFRSLVDARREKFRSAKRNCDKRAIANSIAEEIGRLVPPGRFLTVAQGEGGGGGNNGGDGDGVKSKKAEDESDIHPLILNKKWVPVEESKALDKIYHRLRDQKRIVGKEQRGQTNDKADQRSSARAPRSGMGGVVAIPPGARGDGAGERTVGLSPSVNGRGPIGGSPALHGHGNSSNERNGPSPSISGQTERHGGRSTMHGIGTARGVEGISSNTLAVGHGTGIGGGGPEQIDAGGNPKPRSQLSSLLAEMLSGPSGGSARVHPSSVLEEKKDGGWAPWNGIGEESGGLPGPGGEANCAAEAHWKQPMASISHAGSSMPAPDDTENETPSMPPPSPAWNPCIPANDAHETSAAKAQVALDEEVDSFLRDFSAANDGAPTASVPSLSIPADADALISLGVDCFEPIPDVEEVRELTLQEWIERSRPNTMPGGPVAVADRCEYVKSALPIALKLTECLLEADREEKEDEGNPIPLASIVAGNVLIRAKAANLEVQEESIEYVWIMSRLGDDPDVGGAKPRLFALGSIIYHLFSAERHLYDDDVMASLPMSSIHLRDEVPRENGHRPLKKLQRQWGSSDDKVSDCIAKLDSMGIPSSLCALVGNLLDCFNGDLCGDDAYASLDDVKMDLQLMIDDPSRFLDNIPTNPIPPLSICDKMYGRSDEILKLEESYQQHTSGRCTSVLISGGAGVGKSKLAVHVIQRLTKQSNGYFLSAKFDQNKHLNPLATVGAAFNSLCDQFARDAAPSQLQSVEQELVRALGPQASLLAGIVPSLSKLMPTLVQIETSSSCVDSALSMRFQFGELLRVISSHSRPISIVWDDIQWADSASLLLVGNLLSSIQGGSDGRSAFFIICHRDDAVSESGQFQAWLRSIDSFPLERIKLGSMSDEGVNQLVSDALHLSPRIARPLSSVLHQKSGGNPFFLRQLLESLAEQKLVYVNLSPPRWAWELDKIASLKISDNVVALLMKEMQKLPLDLQLGLKVASCLGSSMKKSILDILSQDLKVDLVDTLLKISQKGYMDSDVRSFCFAHDKIQQAAGKLMSEKERRKCCMQNGLALCTHTLGSGTDDELFFVSVNQMNLGGPDAVHDPQQRTIIAQLNLKAGRSSVDLSDCSTAFQLFKHGISFLGSDHWSSHYRLSIDLFDAAAEAACVLDRSEDVTKYSEQLFANAKTFDDQLNCFHTVVKALMHAEKLKEAAEFTFNIITQLGEELPRAMDQNLFEEIQIVNGILQQTSDDSILNMKESSDQTVITLLKLYVNLAATLQLSQPSLVKAVHLRMVQLTMKNGLTSISPVVFAFYGEILMSVGSIDVACRLARIALKLVERKGSLHHKASVVRSVYQAILWASEPLQSIADAHLVGHKSGQLSGDFLLANFNQMLSITTSYVAGKHLDHVQEDIKKFIGIVQRQNSKHFLAGSVLLHSQTRVLKEGLHTLDDDRVGSIPTESDLLANPRFQANKIAIRTYQIHRLMRAVLFQQLSCISPDHVNLWGDLSELKYMLRTVLVIGIFFQGLASFHLARQRAEEKADWIQRGDAILGNMKEWSEHSAWNWENKAFLLDAEKMHALGNFDRAATLYARAIRSAREHKFIHEEALASELAGMFFHRQGHPAKAAALLVHSIRCYTKWGALAVAKRVETFVATNLDPNFAQLGPIDNDLVDVISASSESSSKKRGVDSPF